MLAEGARQLPLRHISIRVPWNDTDWSGRVCACPKDNLSCLILSRIRDSRDDEREAALAGRSFEELSEAQLPPCALEHGAFMAPYEMTRTATHPYAKSSKAHAHFAPTPFRHPPYSAACIPFNWALRESVDSIVSDLELGFRPELEQQADAGIGFNTNWVQDKRNQLVMLDTFFSAIQPNRSLCFFYAKRTPLAEDTRRVLIGAGWVTHVGPFTEYNYSAPGPLRGILWERAVQHSIRPTFANGFLLPYQQVLAYLEQHPEEDPADYVAFVPDEQFWAFSFGSEHVTNDGAIASLLACARALQNMQRIVAGPWEAVGEWIDARLNELWHMRGPCPGLGATLSAFGVANGALLAHELEAAITKEGEDAPDPWPAVEAVLSDPSALGGRFAKRISDSLRKKWQALPEERRALLRLLSRFELNGEQATRYYVHEDDSRRELRIDVTDADLLANPYLLYELDRVAPDPIRLGTVDRGVFPDVALRERHPLPEPSRVEDPTDARRVRAFVVQDLEARALEGDTLRPRADVVRGIRALEVQPDLPVDGDLMNVLEESFSPIVSTIALADGQPAYQLGRLSAVGDVIRVAVTRRVRGRRHETNTDWRALLDAEFGDSATADDEEETRAREEKAVALQELYASRLSVLAGPAGTGKTTLLKLLCKQPEVEAGGVLLLAPTGKARVRMEEQTGIHGAQTIAQFLLDKDRYYAPTGTYRLSTREKVSVARTVVIDECSMLTEEQLAAVLDAVKGVERLILVGDPQQLPPIGAGRPFLDIVRQLRPDDAEAIFPRVAPGYAELTIQRRQMGRQRDDLLLASWFSGRPTDAGADEVWSRVARGSSDHLCFVRWDSGEELQERLLEVLAKELSIREGEEELCFEQSVGGQVYGKTCYFWAGRGTDDQGRRNGGACLKAASWQILSPVRNYAFGVPALNRMLQQRFRQQTLQYALKAWGRRIPRPMGPEGILYGDKVINVANHRHYQVWPKEDALAYVANGEIGIVVGQFKTKNARYPGQPWQLEVEFSSQPGYAYSYGQDHFREEGNPTLELAYALTVHKAQGSEFGVTFVVLPNPCRLLSRELLYTALTRQQERIVVLHQGELHNLRRFSEDYYSESARRLTNLFRPPSPAEVRDRFLEEGLIHRTRTGECVRSKSEVIIADLLYSKGVEYAYEAPLLGKDGLPRYPDFTIIDDASGQTVYWEHLGMMRVPSYRERWLRKLEWYREQGILPYTEGGGPNGVLVTSEDDAQGGIDSGHIERLIDEVLGV